MWLISLLILAVLAFFIVKYITSQSERKRAEQERLVQSSGIEGSLDHQSNQGSSSVNTPASSSSVSGTGADSIARTGHGSAGAASALAATGAAAAAGASHLALNSGNTLQDVREMIKILNLAEPDAKRLSISPQQLRALRNADQSAIPSDSVLNEVADRLRKMLA